MDITPNHIKILKEVSECGSFSKAATKLGYSQALISKKIKQLEVSLGTQLLTRTPGSVKLTNNGRIVLSRLSNLLANVEKIKEEFELSNFLDQTKIVVGTTSLILETWSKHYTHRFSLCFPGREIQWEKVPSGSFFSNTNIELDLLLDSLSAYEEEHHCNRLQTHTMNFVDFDPNIRYDQSTISINEINFENVVILDEIYNYLTREQSFNKKVLDHALVLNNYREVIDLISNEYKSTILPSFCQAELRNKFELSSMAISNTTDYGIYIHVPRLSEFLILAEGLVRSFNLEENFYEFPKPKIVQKNYHTLDKNIVRIGIQQDSLGQVLAGYGVKYVSDVLLSSHCNNSDFINIGVEENFDFQVSMFASGELMNRQMQRDEIDICVLDDISLLNNGSSFFNDLSFGSKLIGIASYNVSGNDINVVVPKHSSISSISELRRKRISVPFGTCAHRFLLTSLATCGVNSECILVDEDSRTASISLINGSIDAHVCYATFTPLLVGHNFAKEVEQTSATRIPSIRGIVCRSQFIKDYPKSIIAYLHSLVLANRWFLANPLEAANILSTWAFFERSSVIEFYHPVNGSKIDPTLKPQWSYLLKTLNRRLEGMYGISKFDVDFWIDDYFIRLVYNLLKLDYHFQQISLSSELTQSYFIDERFSRYLESFRN